MRMKFRYQIIISLLIYSSLFSIELIQPKIGLVLSGGGAKGFAHIGILKMIDSLQVPIDYIAGTSMGGIVGALYAIGYSGEEIEQLVLKSDWNEIFTDHPNRNKLPFIQKKEIGKYQLELGIEGTRLKPPSGLIFGQKLSLLFSGLTYSYRNVTHFSDLPIPFQCVAVNIKTGDQVLLKEGSLPKAMRATMSIPSVFSPVQWGDSLLVDGGMVNNLPVDVVKEMGADIVIAVDVANPFMQEEDLSSAITILEKSIAMLGINQWKKNVKIADLYMHPDLENFSSMDFTPSKIRRIINAGDQTAHSNMNHFVALLDSLLYQNNGKYQKIPVSLDEKEIKKNQIIFGITIDGNKSLSFNYIYQLLGLKPGDRLDIDQLNRRIMEIYGLGYFETIDYEVESRGDDYVYLHIQVKESHREKLRLGLRYDNKYELIALMAIQGTNMIIPGLRYEHELQFAGLFHYHFKTFYPSRTLNMPVYPYLRCEVQNIPINIFDLYTGEKIAQYKDRSYTGAAGLGFLFGRSLNIEVEYNIEQMDISPNVAFNDPIKFPDYKQTLRKIKSTLIFDNLDDLSTPSYGCYILANYEGSFKKFNSEYPYEVYQISADMYHTIARRHTTRFYGFYGSGKAVPIYKTHNQGHPYTFVGMQFDQLFGTQLSILRMDYRYRLHPNIYLKFIYNKAFDLAQETEYYKIYPHDVSGYGVGLKVITALGPVEFICSRGNKHFGDSEAMQNVYYFLLGSSLDKFLIK